MLPARHQTLGIARHAGTADVRSDVVNAASRRFADFAGQGRTAHALAVHARQVGRYIFFRDAVELRIVLGGEAWPFGRIGTARAAALAVEERSGLVLRGKACGSGQGEQPRPDRIAIGFLQQGAISSCLSYAPALRPMT